MTLLRQERSGSVLLDQLVAESMERRKIFFPTKNDKPTHPPSPSVPASPSVPEPKPNLPRKRVGIYRVPNGQWNWRVRSRDRVIYCGTCCTAEEAHLRYCEAKGAPTYPELLRAEKFRVRSKIGKPEYGPPPVIRSTGWLVIIDIQRMVSWYTGWPLEEIIGHSRIVELVRTRQVAMYLSKMLTPRSLPEIGRMFGRDHSTVHHAVRKIHDAITGENTATRPSGPRGLDPELAKQVEAIKQRLLP